MILKDRSLLIFLVLIIISSSNALAYDDWDGDGFYRETQNYWSLAESKEDCDDFDPDVNPDVIGESFDGKDNDCDGEIDEGLYWRQRKAKNFNTVRDYGSNYYTEGYKNIDSGERYELDDTFNSNFNPINNRSFCNINYDLNVLECDIFDQDHWIEVYQNVSHLVEGDGQGEYRFTYDLVSGTEPEVSVRVNNGEKCTSSDCRFGVNEGQRVDVVFRFTADAQIDNVSLTLVDDGHNLTGIRPTLQSEPFMVQPKPASCCPDDYCWDGSRCIDSDDYMQNTTLLPIVMNSENDGYRCIKYRDEALEIHNTADWVFSKEKADPFNYKKGYCPYPDMCLVTLNYSSPAYNNGAPYYGCAMDGNFTTNERDMSQFFYKDEEYFHDFYCDAGNWTSRTKFVAMTLLEIGRESGEDFLLFCDKAKKEDGTQLFSSLNYFMEVDTNDYPVEPSIFDSNVEAHLFNNFCALIIDSADDEETGEIFDLNDQVFLGAALNTNLDQNIPGFYDDGGTETGEPAGVSGVTTSSVMESLFGDTCEGDPQSSGYRECSSKLYYNDDLWTFIYSSQDIDNMYADELESQENIFEKIIGLFEGMFQNIIDFFKDLISDPRSVYNIDESYLTNDDTFQKLYIAKIGDIQVEGINQRKMNLDEEMADYAYFKYIDYPICTPNDQNIYQLDVSPMSEFRLLAQFVSYEDIRNEQRINCNVTQNDQGQSVHSFIIEGTTGDTSNNNRIDEIWYDLTAKLRPLKQQN